MNHYVYLYGFLTAIIIDICIKYFITEHYQKLAKNASKIIMILTVVLYAAFIS